MPVFDITSPNIPVLNPFVMIGLTIAIIVGTYLLDRRWLKNKENKKIKLKTAEEVRQLQLRTDSLMEDMEEAILCALEQGNEEATISSTNYAKLIALEEQMNKLGYKCKCYEVTEIKGLWSLTVSWSHY